MTMPSTTADAGCSKRPLSSVSIGSNSSDRIVMTVWRRGKAKVGRLLGTAPPKMRTTRRLTCRLPHEIVEMIIAHLTRDFGALKACSLTCRSWYIVAAPHLYRTLVLRDKIYGTPRSELKPLSKLNELGLIPLVEEIQVEQWEGTTGCWFAPQAFSSNDLRYFSAFANVHTLRIQKFDIGSFIPGIERYFEQFSPTLRSIALFHPTCTTPRQLSHFLSLFPNLDDIDIRQFFAPSTHLPDAELVPFSAPKVRGRLTVHLCSGPIVSWKHLIAGCGGLRFRSMNLYHAPSCTATLLKACAETLETLRFHVPDDSARHPAFPKLDLSQLKILRSLEVGGWITSPDLTGGRHTIVMEAFSTIMSPVFSELVVVIWYDQFTNLPSDVAFFKTLRMMEEVRPFRLVFLLQVHSPPSREGRLRLERAVELLTEKGLLDFLDSPTTIRVAQRSL